MRPRRPEPHALAGAYALDAVAGPDKARFEGHLASCPACTRELAELREAAARLAGAVAAEPPGSLMQQVVASAAVKAWLYHHRACRRRGGPRPVQPMNADAPPRWYSLPILPSAGVHCGRW